MRFEMECKYQFIAAVYTFDVLQNETCFVRKISNIDPSANIL